MSSIRIGLQQLLFYFEVAKPFELNKTEQGVEFHRNGKLLCKISLRMPTDFQLIDKGCKLLINRIGIATEDSITNQFVVNVSHESERGFTRW